jgi:succinyl-CoA synthetase alpha subunit
MLHLRNDAALHFLKKKGVSIAENQDSSQASLLAIAVDRSTRTPCILVSNAEDAGKGQSVVKRFSFTHRENPTTQQIKDINTFLSFQTVTLESLSKLINNLIMIHLEKELVILGTHIIETSDGLQIVKADLVADDAAFRSARRQEDIQSLREINLEDPQELQAANDGIVYVKLEGDGNIGTLV